jgi:uncharacterized protein YfaQ (DUF2300 family)
MPGNDDSLKVASDGRVFDGNTRVKILEDRGMDANRLPRSMYDPKPVNGLMCFGAVFSVFVDAYLESKHEDDWQYKCANDPLCT